MAEFSKITAAILVIMLVLVLSIITFPMIKNNIKPFLDLNPFKKANDNKVNLPTSLSDEVKSLLSSSSDFSKGNVSYLIEADKEVLVGFDSVWNDSIDVDACGSNEAIPKPSVCGKKACLCKFKDVSGSDFVESNVISCVTFDGNVVFLGPGDDIDADDYNEGTPKSAALAVPQSYEYLVLYGECGKALPYSQLYVDTFKAKGTSYVYVEVLSAKSEKSRNISYSHFEACGYKDIPGACA